MNNQVEYKDRPPSEDTVHELIRLRNSGEISETDFLWMMGEDPEMEDGYKDPRKMTTAERKRYFAIKAAKERRASGKPPAKRRVTYRKKASLLD